MSIPASHSNNRILIIDDNPAIHEDFRKILQGNDATSPELGDAKAALFGEPDDAPASSSTRFEIDSALQGQEGLEKVRQADQEGRPYAMAFVDVRMPPGWDGVETIKNIWAEFPSLQAVICTAYSDYSWEEMTAEIDNSDNVLILKKPFDNVEALQMAHALTKKWELSEESKAHLDELDTLVSQRTSELRAANENLQNEILERSHAQEALRSSEERFSKAFKASPIPMIIQHQNEERNLDVNDSFIRMTGYSREESIGDQSANFSLWTLPDTSFKIRALLESGSHIRDLSFSLQTKSGQQRDCLVSVERLDLGAENYILIIIQDVTERLELEDQLRQSQKMEAVGQLAAGVAHDFNNILTVILGNSTFHLSGHKLSKEIEKSMQQVSSAAKRATVLTRQLLAYSRKQMIQRQAIDLNELIQNTSGMLSRLIGEKIELVCQLDTDLPPVFADPNSIDQVIINFAVNARDAMEEGGGLTLQTQTVDVDDAHAQHNPEARVGRFVTLKCQDTGTGIDPGDIKRIFEPFFTTKEVGQGTGMGLSMVYGIVKQHDGWIELASSPGQGTTFTVYLPIAERAADISKHSDQSGSPVNLDWSGRTILVVEDEPLVREFVAEVLRQHGCRIITASNGVEAIELWPAERDNIDLLMTDMVMPEAISGRELAQRFVAEKPDLRVIYTSGYSEESIGREPGDADHLFLSKPYPTQKLLETVGLSLAS